MTSIQEMYDILDCVVVPVPTSLLEALDDTTYSTYRIDETRFYDYVLAINTFLEENDLFGWLSASEVRGAMRKILPALEGSREHAIRLVVLIDYLQQEATANEHDDEEGCSPDCDECFEDLLFQQDRNN